VDELDAYGEAFGITLVSRGFPRETSFDGTLVSYAGSRAFESSRPVAEPASRTAQRLQQGLDFPGRPDRVALEERVVTHDGVDRRRRSSYGRRWCLIRRRVTPFFAVLASTLAGVGGSTATAAPVERTHVVTLDVPPLAAYEGGIEGIPATSPRSTGRKINPTDAAVQRYKRYLDGKESDALARLGAVQPAVLYRYRTALAGFASPLTREQAAELRRAPGVAKVVADLPVRVAATPLDEPARVLGGEGPNFLGLPNGLWERLRRCDRWRHRLRHPPRESQFRGSADRQRSAPLLGRAIRGALRLAWDLPSRSKVHEGHLQQQADRRSLLLRGLRSPEHQQG
jgi:hypothetical protein